MIWRDHINAVHTANRLARPEALNIAQDYGLRIITAAGFLHSHVKQSGELTGESTMEQVLEGVLDHAGAVKDHPHLLAYLVYDEPRPLLPA